jgi:hypothetical protein
LAFKKKVSSKTGLGQKRALLATLQRQAGRLGGKASPQMLARINKLKQELATGNVSIGPETRLEYPARQQGGQGNSELDPMSMLEAFMNGDGSGSGSWGSSQAGSEYDAANAKQAAADEHARAIEILKMQQEFEAQQEAARIEAQRQAQLAELKQQRQSTFVDMLGRDPVRAVLFALGLGPEADQFNISAKQLGETLQPMEGAQQKEQEHEGALKGLLGSGKFGTTAGANADIGTGGVTGLGGAEQAARAFAQGGVDAQKLLTSAFGVGGNKPGEGGLSPESLIEKVKSVTPKGIL